MRRPLRFEQLSFGRVRIVFYFKRTVVCTHVRPYQPAVSLCIYAFVASRRIWLQTKCREIHAIKNEKKWRHTHQREKHVYSYFKYSIFALLCFLHTKKEKKKKTKKLAHSMLNNQKSVNNLSKAELWPRASRNQFFELSVCTPHTPNMLKWIANIAVNELNVCINNAKMEFCSEVTASKANISAKETSYFYRSKEKKKKKKRVKTNTNKSLKIWHLIFLMRRQM